MSESRDETHLMDEGGEDSRRVSGGTRVTLDELVGRTLDERYLVDELIGQGAMGAVFRARQTRLRRTVALKVPKPELCTMPEFIGRFEREALSMARLVHQNIVQIFDVCVSKDPAQPTFLVMEYIEGVELDKFLRGQEKDLTVAAVIEIFRQIAEGLEVAHDRGIVHRDIKPSNIIITMPQRVAKIMDFGVAKIALENAFETTDSRAIGTPAFMAPEQVQGKEVTPAADLYAFAVMIYRLLTRALPYDANTSSALLFAHVSEPSIDPTRRNPNLPTALDAVMRKALAKNPAERHEGARQLAEAVAQALQPVQGRQFADLLAVAPVNPELDVTQTDETTANPASPVEKPWFLRPPAMVGAAGLVLLLVGIGLTQRGGDREPADEPVSIAAAKPSPTPDATPEPTPVEILARPTPAPITPTATPPPKASPSASPSPGSTSAPPAVTPDLWDRDVYPPNLTFTERRAVQAAIEADLRRQIGEPIAKGLFTPEDNALARVEGPTAATILQRVQAVYSNYATVTARFRATADSVFWRDRAALKLEVNVYGRPKTIPDPAFRQALLKTEEPLAAWAHLTDDGWTLIRLTGDIPETKW